jgi:hypothetical protein
MLVLAGIGATIFFAARSSGGNFFTGRTQPYATAEQSKTLRVDAKNPVRLKVIDDAGSVTVVGANVETVEVKVVKTAHANTESAAQDEVKNIKYDIEQTGNGITLAYDLPNTTVFDFNLNTIDFVVTVPVETTVDIANNLGEASVANTKGNVVVKDDFGNITVENIEGALTVHTNSGKVNATSIMAGEENIDLRSDFGDVILKKAGGKDISLDSNSGEITLSEVRATGDLIMNTDFGSTSFENGSAHSLHVETNSGAVSLVNLNIDKQIFVKDDFGNIELERTLGDSYDLHTNSGSITIDGAQGTLKADTDFGNIAIQNAESVTLTVETNGGAVEFSGSLAEGPHTVKSDFGKIDLTLPTDSKLDMDLKTDFGKITSDLPITVTLNGSSHSNGDHIVGSVNGGGEQLTVQANSGNIRIRASK